MTAILYYGIPIVLGAASGYVLSMPVNAILTLVSVVFAGWLLWATKDAEIGSMMGVIVAVAAATFLLSMWVTIAVVSGASVNLSWMLRASP